MNTFKKHINGFIMGLVLISSATLAQQAEVPTLPMDKETNQVVYTKVMDMPATPKADLYARGMAWFSSYFKNPTEVVREKDPEVGTIMGVSRFKISNVDEKGIKTDAGLVQYTVKLFCKDNKYKYDIVDINWKQASKFPIEKWMDKKAPGYKPAYESYLKQTDENIKLIMADLEKAMAKKEGKKSTDW